MHCDVRTGGSLPRILTALKKDFADHGHGRTEEGGIGMNKSSARVTAFFGVFFLLGLTVVSWADQGTLSLEDRVKALEERLSRTQALEEKVVKLEAENELLKNRVAVLDNLALAKPAAPDKSKPEPALLEKIGTKLKIKGRWGTGFFKSNQGGSYPHGSFEVPEGKVQMAYNPDDINTIIMRMSLNNAAFTSVDYFYVDSKDFLPGLKHTPYTLETRIGRFKLQYGEETWSNNIVESALISNSASNAAVSDEGIQLSGKVTKPEWFKNPLKWFFAVTNGSTLTGSDNATPKSFSGKLAYSPTDPLSLSASIYNSGSLKTAAAEMSVAGITARPTGATRWDRTMWEIDARWDFEKGKALDPPAYTDSKAYLRGAFGQMFDDAGAVPDREANYGYVEGLYNFHPKWYTALRWGLVDLRHDASSVLNGVTGQNQLLTQWYTRYSAALGYRWSDKTLIKLGYDLNRSGGVDGIDDPSDNLLSLVLVSSF
jgi:hypothetical protein